MARSKDSRNSPPLQRKGGAASARVGEGAIERQYVSTMTADALRAQIAEGKWERYLPGEHFLCGSFQVSRHTLRLALEILRAEGVIQSQKGKRTEILKVPSARTKMRGGVINLISPDAVADFSPFMFGWVHELRQILFRRGFTLQVHQTVRIYQRFSEKLLREYVRELKGDLWILHISTYDIQQWFMKSGLPVLLAGTPHPGITLPFVDVHSRAAARHAAGRLLALGHRDIAFLCPDRHFAGDYAGVSGIKEAMGALHEDCPRSLEVVEYSSEPGSLYRRFRFLFDLDRPPTAIITSNAAIIPGLLSVLMQLRKRVPEDVSLVALQSAQFFSYMTPALACYTSDPVSYAKKLSQSALAIIQANPLRPWNGWVIPESTPGESVASPKGGAWES